MLQAIDLKCEALPNPVGIGERRPSFSWRLSSDKTGVLQKAFRAQVATDEKFKKIVWDSGEVADGGGAAVYGGAKLKSFTKYFFRVTVKDNHNEKSPWSEAGMFETAGLDEGILKGSFIRHAADKPESSKAYYFRKRFGVKGAVASARVYATALGMYELYLNGQDISLGKFTPGWTEYRKRLQYQTYDITALLAEGDNAIAAHVGAGWYKGCLAFDGGRNFYGKHTAFYAEIVIDYADGAKEILRADERWKTHDSPLVYSELYHGEVYDARLEPNGWSTADFDDSKWRRAKAVDFGMSVLTPQDGVFVKTGETFKPAAFFTTPNGERVLDFGQNLAGYVRFRVNGKEGARAILRHAEVLDRDGNFYTENLRGARAKVEYICKGGAEEAFDEHFSFQGFRYVCVDEWPGEINPDDFEAVAVYSDMGETGSFTCSDESLNRLVKNVSWGLKSNFIDVPTDCPQRDERLGWTGDAQVFIKTATYLMNTRTFYKKWLRDMAACQLKSGGVPEVIPDLHTDADETRCHSQTGWADAAVICPWTVYLAYGDRELLAEQYPSMKKWVQYIKSHAENGLIWNSGFHFGDWVALDAKEGSYFGATPNDFIATAYYAYSTEILSHAAAVLGLEKDAEKWRRLHGKVRKAFQAEFYTPTGRLAARTQTAHVLSLMFGLCPEKHRQRTMDTLLDLLDENGGHLTTGFLGTPYICHVLSDNNKWDAAYALLMKDDYPSWLYQVKAGATTIWEHWDGIKPDGSMWSADMNSFNHYAYGSVADWIYKHVGGLDFDRENPGYKRFIVKPRPGGGITSAKTEYDCPHGKIRIAWEIKDGKMSLDLSVPHNTTAEVCLPGAAEGEHGGVHFKGCKEGARAEVGSGEYAFEWENRRS